MNKIQKLASALSFSVVGLAALPTVAAQPPPDPTPADRGNPAPADKGTPTPAMAKQDADFFDDASQGSLLEVKLGQLAAKNAASDEVKKYGQRMVEDHTRLNQQLNQLAAGKKGMTVPQVLDKKHQDVVDKLSQYAGAKFDREYMSRMVSDHEDDVKAFEKQAKDGKDTELKQLAAGALPLLHDHLSQAKDIEGRLKK